MVRQKRWQEVYEAQAVKQNAQWPKLDAGLFPKDGEVEGAFWPAIGTVYRALSEMPYQDVQILILGQDPYPEDYAMGVAFAIPNDCQAETPQSLRRIMKAIYGEEEEGNRDLAGWRTGNGVLLLNAALTVPQRENGQSVRDVAGKHAKYWRPFVTEIIHQVAKGDAQIIGWGAKSRDLLKRTLPSNRWSWCNHPMASSRNKPFHTSSTIPSVIPWRR